jgi:AhpD family alkylhydroperoxidase
MSTTTETTWIDLRREGPDAYRALAALTRAGHLEPVLLELVKVRASILNGCRHCIEGHVEIALRAGEDRARIEALHDWRSSGLFTERERAALALTDAMTLLPTGGPPPAEVVAAAGALFPGDELARLIVAITGINAWNRIALTTAMGRSEA